jgi:D-amino peptidase
MKVYISADIEGVAGITLPDEARPTCPDTAYFQKQMTDEVCAACRGALAAGATEIFVKDAHAAGTNIDFEKLPESVKLIRGWSGHPFCMMQELDESFDAALMIGYHSKAGSGDNPLSHSFDSSTVYEMRLNEKAVSEFDINYMTSMMLGVPVVFVSGDSALCREVKEVDENIKTVSTFQGKGRSTLSIHPQMSVKLIEERVKKSLSGDLEIFAITLPKEFKLEIDFKSPQQAYSNSFYPGAKLIGHRTVQFESPDFFEVLKMLKFTL